MQALYYRANPKREWIIVGEPSRHLNITVGLIQYLWRDSQHLTGEVAIVESQILPTRWTLQFRKGEGRVIWRGRLKSCFPDKWERIKQNGRKVWRPVNEKQGVFKWTQNQ